MANDKKDISKQTSASSVSDFIKKVATTPVVKAAGKRGRLIFAMDATASREPTWDRACQIQGEMFAQTATLGGLEIQLCYYRGFDEFDASPWLTGSEELLSRMSSVSCQGGYTKIEKVLRHVINETGNRKVNALVFVGDCMEENAQQIEQLGAKLGMLGVPVFVFHEGIDPVAAQCFRQIARLTNGAYCNFDSNSAQELRDLLGAVAVYAAGGRRALKDFSQRKGGVTKLLAHQIEKD